MNLSEDLQQAVADARAKLRVGYPWWLRPLLRKNIIAITLGRRIYIQRPPLELDRLIRHELAHVRQVNRLGLPLFLLRYAFEFLRNLWRERSFERAYRAISFEREAYAAEEPIIRATR